MMNIVACASDNYAMQCGVLFLSICMSNQNVPIDFYVLTDNAFQAENKSRIEDIVHRFNPQNSLKFISVDEALVSGFKNITNKYYPKQVLYRLFVADLLPKEINRALYLDCDIIVRHSLLDLWETDLSSISVACVPDALSGIVGIFNRLGYPQRYGYFNSGVLLINLTYWREHNISQRFVQFAQTTKVKITLPDQDILNSVLYCSIKMLPLTYNSQSGFLYKLEHISYDYYGNKDEIEQACIDPVVLHLAGERPWNKGCNHPYKDEFYKFKALTPWKDEPIKRVTYNKKDQIKRVLRQLLCNFGLVKELPDVYNRNYCLNS